jgi:hypothetical protein
MPLTVDLINIDDDWQTFALRSVLECYGITTVLHPIATAAQLVALLDGSAALSQHIVVMCHGCEDGIALPELAPEIEAAQPYRKILTAENLQEFLHLPIRLFSIRDAHQQCGVRRCTLESRVPVLHRSGRLS